MRYDPAGKIGKYITNIQRDLQLFARKIRQIIPVLPEADKLIVGHLGINVRELFGCDLQRFGISHVRCSRCNEKGGPPDSTARQECPASVVRQRGKIAPPHCVSGTGRQ